MAFTQHFLKNKICQRFSFFAHGDGAVENMDEHVSKTGYFELGEIRVHFSGVCSADIYFRVKLSAVEGSHHDILLISKALSNSADYTWQPSMQRMLFMSGDTLNISCITDNTWGLNVSGWAVTAAG